ncbi:hypothetical protein [Halorhodospira neutriphila]|uniref:Flagellar M-ring protein FliF n=1 Tax=Halorhodospira neutriphila TaxID=168379 RepID=A0ABS1E2R5_9GAMM|nr:hypothetical protein [Halorhodospira neutriphila]MBK1725986.1 hypothetical protein [Halorhodospira neutriphila]
MARASSKEEPLEARLTSCGSRSAQDRKIRELRELALQDPQHAAAVLTSWLAESAGRSKGGAGAR